jgi:serine/threonine protein kinase
VDANGVIKLSDFGLVWTLEDRMAPELANHGYYGQPADVYIFGLMLWELWYGKRIPTNKPTLGGKQKKRDQPDMPADDQPPWAEVIRDCWKVAPVDRPLFKQIVEKLEAYKKQLG